MFKERDILLKRIFVVLDTLVVSFSFFIVFFLRGVFPNIYRLNFIPFVHVVKPPSLIISDYFMVYVFMLGFWCITLYLNGMYRYVHFRSLLEVCWIIIKSAFIVVIFFGTTVFLLKLQFVSRLFFIIFMTATSAFLIVEKTIIFYITGRLLSHGYNQKRVLIVGTGRRARYITERIKKNPEWGLKVVKIVDYEECPPGDTKKIQGCEVIERPGDLSMILHRDQIDQVIFVVPRSKLDTIEKHIYVCDDEGVDTGVAADLFDIKVSELRHTDIDGIPLIMLERTFGKEWQLFAKRIIDIIVSGFSLLILTPVFLLVAILIKLTSPGPVFFRQRRIGLHGREFTMYKFRSMYKEAEEELEKLKEFNEMEGPVFKIRNDPRITPVGKFLRRLSIDEVPQLLNVFLGRLSLVGPRPALAREIEQYKPWQRRRLSVRPGVTCLWQVKHRGDKDFMKWMEADLEYVDKWSLWLDFTIMVKTIIVVISGKGAY